MDESERKLVEEANAYCIRLEEMSSEDLRSEYDRVLPDAAFMSEKDARTKLLQHKLWRGASKPRCGQSVNHAGGGAGDVFADLVRWYIWIFWAMLIIAPFIYCLGKAMGFFPGTPPHFPWEFTE